MGEQDVSVQECIDRNQELMLRRVVYEKLQKNGFYPTRLLKSGKAVGGGMINADQLEVSCGFADGVHSIHIFLPVSEGVREDKFFKRTNAGGRSVLVSFRTFPSDEGAFDGVDEIKQMVEECWPDIEEIIKHGEMILYYNKDKIYPDFPKEDPRSEKAGESNNQNSIFFLQFALVGSILGTALNQDAASDVLNFLSTHSIDAPDAIKDYMSMFAKYPVLQRALSAAYVLGVVGPFLLSLKNGIVKIIEKSGVVGKKK